MTQKYFKFLFQAKVILGFTASVGLEEMSIELIHQKFMAKLQLVTASEKLIYFDTIGAKNPIKQIIQVLLPGKPWIIKRKSK